MKSDQSRRRAFLRVGVTTAVLALGGVGSEAPLGALCPAQLNELAPTEISAPEFVPDMRGGSSAQEATAVRTGLKTSDWAGIRAAYERHRHQVVPVAGHLSQWRARNPGQHWQTRFDERGFLVEPDSGAWTWGLELQRYGVVGAEREVGPEAQVRAEAQRVTYTWDTIVDEWFVNDARGLEHGFTLRERPAGGRGPVTLWLGVRGGLRPSVQSAGHGVAFLNARSESVVSYTGLMVADANGRALAARFEAAGDGLRLVVEDHGARYPLTIDPVAQQAYLKASNTGSEDQFGTSVAVSGDTVVVGAQGEDSNATGVDGNQTNNSASNAGAAYVFVRSGGVWTQQAYLKASNTGNPGDYGDLFGYSVAVSGDTVVVGAPFEDSNATGVDGNQANNSASNSGAAYVFVRSGGVWSQQAYVKASNTGTADQFGASIAVSDDTIVIGANLEESNASAVDGDQANNSAYGAGAAYVFGRSGGVWVQQAYLKASNTGSEDMFGTSVTVSGDMAVVGAHGEDSNATGIDGDQADNTASGAGAAYVFVRSGGVWSQQAYLKASNTGAGDVFGFSVAAWDDTLVVGAYFESSSATGVDGDQANNSAFRSGAAYVFVRSGSVWSQQEYLKASNTAAEAFFGFSVAVWGDTVGVGAPFEDSNATGVDGDQTNTGAEDAGAAYAFARSGGVWSQQAYVKASNTGTVGGLGDLFGWSVAVSDDTVVVGATGERSNATGVDGDQSNNSYANSGAAYVFTVGGNTSVGTDVGVAVSAALPNGSPTSVSLSFDQITTSGQTSITTSSSGPPPPTGFKLTSPPVYYEITTTATFSGNVRVCLNWSEGQIANENNVKLFHHESGQWVDITDPSSRDTVTNVVCGTATSLSPFTLFEIEYSFAGFFQPVDNPPVVNSIKAGAAVPVKFSLGGFLGLDIFAGGYPRSVLVQCSTGAPLDAIEETLTAGASSLSYDSSTDQYKYIWKTDKAWAGSCRQLELRLSDGEVYRAHFALSR